MYYIRNATCPLGWAVTVKAFERCNLSVKCSECSTIPFPLIQVRPWSVRRLIGRDPILYLWTCFHSWLLNEAYNCHPCLYWAWQMSHVIASRYFITLPRSGFMYRLDHSSCSTWLNHITVYRRAGAQCGWNRRCNQVILFVFKLMCL